MLMTIPKMQSVKSLQTICKNRTVPARKNIKRLQLNVEPDKSVTANNDNDSSSDSDINEPILKNENSDKDTTKDIAEETENETKYFELKKIKKLKPGSTFWLRPTADLEKKTIHRYVALVQNVTFQKHNTEIKLIGLKSLHN